MGASKSKQPDKISYKSQLFPSLVTLNLSEPFEYPPRPRKTELLTQFDQILSEIEIVSADKNSILANFPKSLKWKLICRHRDFVMKNIGSIAESDKSEAQLIITKLRDNASHQNLKALNSWLRTAEKNEIREFYDFSGMRILFEFLEVSEVCSRTQGGFAKQIEILRAVDLLVREREGAEEVLKINNGISILFLNFNEVHVEITGLVLGILGFLLWETENDAKTFNAIFEAIDRYKMENGLADRLGVFVGICQKSLNIMFIEHILNFVISLVSAPLDMDKRRALRAELTAAGIEAVLQNLREKIKRNEFKIGDCTFEAMKAILEKKYKLEKNDNKFLAKAYTISEFVTQDEKISDYEKHSTDRIKNRNRNYLDDLMKFQTQTKLSLTSSQPLDQEIKAFQTFFLSDSDVEAFEEHLKTVSNQIDAFEKCDDESVIKAKSIDFNDQSILFNELRDHAKKIEAFPELLMILQKLGTMNKKSLYIWLEEILTQLKEQSDQNPGFQVPSNFKKLLKDAQKYEDLEEKYEALQMLSVKQEKIIANLKQDLENSISQQEKKALNQTKETNLGAGASIPIIDNKTTNNNNSNPTIETNKNDNNDPIPTAPILPASFIAAIKGNAPATGLPPPPPSFLKAPLLNIQKLPTKEKRKPKVAMKPLMWNTVGAGKLKDTIWEKIDDSHVDLDLESLEREFFLQSAAASKPAGKSPDKEIVIAKEKITVLPPEKSKNLEIVLSKLKLDSEVFKSALMTFDSDSLNPNAIESLIAVIPPEADLRTIRDFGDGESLATPERFLWTISSVPGLIDRLNAIKFRWIQEEMIEELEDKIDGLTKVWGGIPKDDRFKKILEYVLAVGNYLNGESARGGAFGFRLDCLDKLGDVKTNAEKNSNLLNYIILRLDKSNGGKFIDENMDLAGFDMAAKTPLSQLWADLGEIKKGTKSLQAAILSRCSDKDKVEERLGELSAKLIKKVENMSDKIKECERMYETAANYLGENPKDSSERLAERLFKFWLSLRNAKRAMIKDQIAKKHQEERSKATEVAKVTKKPTISPGIINQNQILETIKMKRMSKSTLLIN